MALKSNIKFCSYNCHSLRKNIDLVRVLVEDNDVLLLQEIILLEEDISILDSVCNDTEYLVVPSSRAISNCFNGRPTGGLAVIYKKSLSLSFKVEESCCNYISRVSSILVDLLLVNGYMPYDDRSDDTRAGYQQILGNLQASLEYLTFDNIVIVGDFNADPGRGRLWHYLYDFIQSNELVCADLNLPVDSFTYLSPAHNTTAWLDHVITNKNTSIKNIKICNDIAVYDHFPVSLYRSTSVIMNAS